MVSIVENKNILNIITVNDSEKQYFIVTLEFVFDSSYYTHLNRANNIWITYLKKEKINYDQIFRKYVNVFLSTIKIRPLWD